MTKMRAIFGVDEGTDAMEAMFDNYPQLLKVHQLPNVDKEIMSGVVAIHKPDTEVHPDSVSNEMFEYLLVCPIHDTDLSDADFDKKKLEQIPQFSDRPPRLRGVRSHSSVDGAVWAPELGENGYAGIFKQIGRENKYFVVAKVSAPVACREFRRHIVNGERRKFSELVYDPDYNFTKNLAKRNAERIAYCVARAMGVQIKQVEDVSALAREAYIAKPFRAAPLPGWCQSVSVIEPVSHAGEECMGVFHNARSPQKAAKTCLVNAGPYDGITVFNMRGNNCGVGMPADTGYGKPKDVSESEMAKRAKAFTWEARGDDFHPELLPGRHNAIDNEFLRKMASLGWKQEGLDDRQTLTPVAVKIGNPEIKRK